MALKIPVSAQKKRRIFITMMRDVPEKNGNFHVSSQIFICVCDNTSLQKKRLINIINPGY